MKIVINRQHGGFGLSPKATRLWAERKGREIPTGLEEPERNDPDLVAVVEELGEAANGRFSKLRVVEIPDGVEWQIEEYDGLEWIAEKHRTWGDSQ